MIRARRFVFSSLLCLAATVTALGEGRPELGMEWAVPGGDLSVGVPFQLMLYAKNPPRSTGIFPRSLDLGSEFLVLSWEEEHLEAANETRRIYTVHCLAEGRLAVPAIPAGESMAGAFFNEPCSVQVRTFEDLEGPAPVKPDLLQVPVAPGSPGIDPLYIILAIVAVVLAVLGLIVLKKKTPETERPVSPASAALQALDRLRDRTITARSEVDRFYVELSAIVRSFVEARFNVPARKHTTEETSSALADLEALAREDGQRLDRLLLGADRIKFFTKDPDPDRQAADLAAARTLVIDLEDHAGEQAGEGGSC